MPGEKNQENLSRQLNLGSDIPTCGPVSQEKPSFQNTHPPVFTTALHIAAKTQTQENVY